MDRRYSLAIETEKSPCTETQNEPIIGFLVERSTSAKRSESPSTACQTEKPKSAGQYSLCDLDNISQLNYQFHTSPTAVDPRKKHLRRHTVAVKFQVPHSANSINVAGQS